MLKGHWAASLCRLKVFELSCGPPGAQRPLRAASPQRLELLGSSFGAQRPLRAASPYELEAALVLKGFSFELPPA